jgi:hypothetical protein
MGFTHRANDYVAEYCAAAPDRLIPMGGVHPRMAEDAGAEVRRAAALGVRALKVHPPHMGFAANAYLDGLDGLRAVYEEAQRLRLVVMIHTGTSIFPGARSRLGEAINADDVAVDSPTCGSSRPRRTPALMGQAFFLVRGSPACTWTYGIRPRRCCATSAAGRRGGQGALRQRLALAGREEHGRQRARLPRLPLPEEAPEDPGRQRPRPVLRPLTTAHVRPRWTLLRRRARRAIPSACAVAGHDRRRASPRVKPVRPAAWPLLAFGLGQLVVG